MDWTRRCGIRGRSMPENDQVADGRRYARSDSRSGLWLGWGVLSIALVISPAAGGAESYDLLIRGGRVVDGTGAPGMPRTSAIRDGRIAAIGRLDEARGRPDDRRRGPVRRARVHRHDGPDGGRVPRGPAERRQPAAPGDHDDQRRRGAVGRPARRQGGRARRLAHDGRVLRPARPGRDADERRPDRRPHPGPPDRPRRRRPPGHARRARSG